MWTSCFLRVICVEQGFSKWALLAFGVRSFFVGGLCCALYHVSLVSIHYAAVLPPPPPLPPPAAQALTTKNASRFCQTSAGGQNCACWEPAVESHSLIVGWALFGHLLLSHPLTLNPEDVRALDFQVGPCTTQQVVTLALQRVDPIPGHGHILPTCLALVDRPLGRHNALWIKATLPGGTYRALQCLTLACFWRALCPSPGQPPTSAHPHSAPSSLR